MQIAAHLAHRWNHWHYITHVWWLIREGASGWPEETACDRRPGARDSEQAWHVVRLAESSPQPQLQQVGHPQARTFCVPLVRCLDYPCQEKTSSWLPTHHAMGLPAREVGGHPLSWEASGHPPLPMPKTPLGAESGRPDGAWCTRGGGLGSRPMPELRP